MKGFMTLLLMLFNIGFVVNAQNVHQADTVVVLAMHGGIPKDFPKEELKLFRELHKKGDSGNQQAHDQAHQLEVKLRNWPRTKDNDPFYWGALQIKNAMENMLPYPVLLSFNEVSAPSIEDAIAKAVSELNPKTILVITPMLTPGGRHSEKDIPAAIERAKKKVGVKKTIIEYVWPIPVEETAQFLIEQIKAYQSISTAK
jgi:sirohydrochlorin ferrochelatase